MSSFLATVGVIVETNARGATVTYTAPKKHVATALKGIVTILAHVHMDITSTRVAGPDATIRPSTDVGMRVTWNWRG